MMALKLVAASALTVALSGTACYGDVTIATVGAGTGYDATTAQSQAWRSTDVAKGTLDFYGNEAFGSAGFWTAGNGSLVANGGTPTITPPAWATNFAVGAFHSAGLAAYTDYDNPTLDIGTSLADWDVTGLAGSTTGGGVWSTYLTFDMAASAPGSFRLGVMAGNENTADGRWDPAGLRLSFNGGTAVAVTGLDVTDLGMVFWDVSTDGTAGTFTIEGQGRVTGVPSDKRRGGTMSAVSFDVVSAPYDASTLEWNPTGPGNAVSLYQEANWIDPVTGTTPPTGIVDPSVALNRSLIIRAGTPGGDAGVDGSLMLGTGDLTVSNATLRMSETTFSGINMGNGPKDLIIVDGKVFTQAVSGGNVSMDGYSDLTLYGSNPLNSGTTVDLKSSDCFVYFLNKLPSEVNNAELSKFTVKGAAATGNNVLVTQYYNGAVIRPKLPNDHVMKGFGGMNLSGTKWNFGTGFKGRVGAGLIAYNGGTYNVDGWGADIWGTGDECRFTYNDVAGDAEIIAKVAWVQDTHVWAKGGVMMRSDLTAGSSNAFVFQRPDKQITFQSRTAAGGSTTSIGPVGGTGSVKWVRLVRSGDNFSGYYSTSSATGPWTQVGATTSITMPSTVKAGIAATSHLGLERGRTNFQGVSTVPASSISNYGIFDESVDIEPSWWIEDEMSSFLLKKGYMVTVSTEGGGQGFSKVYVATEADLKVNLPASLNNEVRFMRILPWRWIAKRGWGGSRTDHQTLLQTYWNYEWEPTGSSGTNREFVPMIKGRGQDKEFRWLEVRARAGQTHFLGFNEPESSNQGDLTVDEAIALWPKAQQLGLRLGSPARTDGNNGNNWLSSFMSKADAKGYRVDFVCVHNYNKKTASSLKSWLTTEYNKYGRPIWLTEFQRETNDDPTGAQHEAYLAEVIPMLESLPFLERYAYYNFNTANPSNSFASLFNNGPVLNARGQIYRDVVSQQGYVNSGQSAWATATLDQPTGGILQPSNGGVITATTSIDSGKVSKVEFFVNGVSAGADSSSPYQLSIASLDYGMKSIYSVVTTNFGERITTGTSQVFVTDFGLLDSSPGPAGEISWSAVPGEIYHLESSDDLSGWDEVAERVATGFVESATDPDWGSETKMFHRVRWE